MLLMLVCSPWSNTVDVMLMPCRLPMCHQTNLRFYNDIAYDKQYTGLILGGFEGTSAYKYMWSHVRQHHV